MNYSNAEEGLKIQGGKKIYELDRLHRNRAKVK